LPPPLRGTARGLGAERGNLPIFSPDPGALVLDASALKLLILRCLSRRGSFCAGGCRRCANYARADAVVLLSVDPVQELWP
jgi:hypothetical protein